MKSMKGARTGLQLNVANIGKDEAGFDNLEDFWDASGNFDCLLILYFTANIKKCFHI